MVGSPKLLAYLLISGLPDRVRTFGRNLKVSRCLRYGRLTDQCYEAMSASVILHPVTDLTIPSSLRILGSARQLHPR
jgi:hypothetical protein